MAYMPNPRESAATQQGSTRRKVERFGVLDDSSTKAFLDEIGQPPRDATWKEIILQDDLPLTCYLPKANGAPQRSKPETLVAALPRGIKIAACFKNGSLSSGYTTDFPYKGMNGQARFTVETVVRDGKPVSQVSMQHTAH